MNLCIAAISRKGGFTEVELSAFFKSNRDGGGFAWVEDGKLETLRHITVHDDYLREGERLKDVPNLVTHCRIRTMGTVARENAHPFTLPGGKAVMVHNGSFFFTEEVQGWSDTRYIAEKGGKILAEEGLMKKDDIRKQVETIIGINNKLILLYESGEFVIVNEDQGSWVEDKWYSNRNFDWYLRQQNNLATINAATGRTKTALEQKFWDDYDQE